MNVFLLAALLLVRPEPGDSVLFNLIGNDSIRTLHLINIESQKNTFSLIPLQNGTLNALFDGKKTQVIHLGQSNANLSTNNVRQVMAKIPGLHIWENDGSGLQIGVATRGLSPNRSWELNVRQDGADVSADPFGYPEAYYNPPLDAVQQIQFIRGSASLQFGPQFGGVLNYAIKEPDTTRKIGVELKNTIGSYGMISSYTGLGGKVGKTEYYTFYNYRRADGWRENSKYLVHNAYAMVRHRFSKKFSVATSHSLLYSEAQQAGGLSDAQYGRNHQASSRSRNWFSIPWYVPSLELMYRPSASSSLQLKAFALVGERNSIGTTRSIQFADSASTVSGALSNRQIDRDRYENAGAELRYLQQWKTGAQVHTLAAGLRYFSGYTSRRGSGRGDQGSEFNLDLQPDPAHAATDPPFFGRNLNLNTQNFAAFAEQSFQLGKWRLIPGVRYEIIQNRIAGRLSYGSKGEVLLNEDQRNRGFLLAGAAIQGDILPGIQVYGNCSQAYRAVTFSELTPPATTDVVDPDLKDSRGYTADAGLRGKLGNCLRFDAGLFYINYQNRVGTLPLKDDAGLIYQFRTNVGSTVSQGIELYLESDPLQAALPSLNAGTRIYASMSFIDARYGDFTVSSVKNNVIEEKNLKGNRVEYAPRYIHRFGTQLWYKNFTLDAQYSMTGKFFTDAANTEAPNATATIGLLEGYKTLDLSLGYEPYRFLRISAGVNNALNEKYATRRAGGYPGPGILPGDGRNYYLSARFLF